MNEAPTTPRGWADADTVRTVAYWVIALAGTWWLLRELQAVLRPLLLAAFLAYVLLPYYSRLRKKLPAWLAIGILSSVTGVLLAAFAVSIYGSVIGLADELPELQSKLGRTFQWVDKSVRDLKADLKQSWIGAMIPQDPESITIDETPSTATPKPTSWLNLTTESLTTMVRTLAKLAAGGFLEAAATGLYLLFLLIGAERFPGRVRSAYPNDQAEQILDVAGRINSAIVSYLKAKVKSSLVLALPIGILLAFFGVKFSLLWVILTFLCNFIPYVGSIAAYALPVGFAFLQFGFGIPAILVASLIMVWHLVCAMLLEPMLIGQAVGISPLLILAALSVWGLLWGLPGMFLAVPLTVVLKIVFENIAATRSVAMLLMEE
jgi:AI-2 transport protein TqsA